MTTKPHHPRYPRYPVCPAEDCGRPVTDNAILCRSCGAELHQELSAVAGDLAADLDVSLARQARLGTGATVRGRETPLAYGEAAAAAKWKLHNTLVAWVLVLRRDDRRPLDGPVCRTCLHPSCEWLRSFDRPADTIPAMAAWLASRVEDLRRHPLAADAIDELTDAITDARHAIDRPDDRLYCGPCGRRLDDGTRCKIDLYARPGAATITCRCGRIWDIRRRRDWLLAEAEDTLGTATEIARAVTTLAGETIKADRIWKWHSRGRLVARGRTTNGHPTFRVGDVLDLLDTVAAPPIIGPTCVRCRHRTCTWIHNRTVRRTSEAS